MKKILNKKENTGITLVALVITIIIILILSGISIKAIISTGIFSKANTAVNRYKESQIEEQMKLAKYQLEMTTNNETLKDIFVENGVINQEQVETGFINVDENIIFITNYKGLQELSKQAENGDDFSNKYIYLLNDIECENSIDMEEGKLISGESFKPIVVFNGTIDGNNYSIKNLYIKMENVGAALISKLNENGIIKNLCIDNSYIEGKGITGAIVGKSNGTISNCINKSIIISQGKLCGGICGYSLGGNISNCINYGKITGNAQLGGIVGDSQGTENNIVSVSNCINYGEVSEKYNKDQCGLIGGIVGYNAIYSEISNCENKANVNGVSGYVAGITGSNYYIIKKCINSGKIEVTRQEIISKLYVICGGICGISRGNIEECGNFGNVISNYNKEDDNDGQYVGGICGSSSLLNANNPVFDNIFITKSYNYGTVNGYKWVGGIAGRINVNSNIENCYNSGKIISEDRAGGICGTLPNTNTKILNCYNRGEISANSNFGGIVGISVCYVENVYSIGKITYSNSTQNYGMVFGTLMDNASSVNCFYINNNDIDGVGYETTSGLGKTVLAKTSEELKGLVNDLGDAYIQDDNINDGYPYLKDNKPLK